MSNNAENLYSDIAIKLAGSDAPTNFLRNVIALTVENSLHLPDVATLVLHDASLHWIDETSVMPGTTIEIQAKAGTVTSQLFDGEVVELEANFEHGTQQLTIRAFDRMHRLARGRKVRSFVNVTDADIITQLAREVGLSATVDPTSIVHPYVFQNDETNLEFLQQRASALGYLLYVKGKKLYCEVPRSHEETVNLEWGRELGDFRPRLTTIGQVNQVTVRGWDPAVKQGVVGQQAKKGEDSPRIGETQSGGDLALKAFSVDATILVANRPIRNQEVAQKLAQAVANQRAGSFVEAEGSCEGTPKLVAGTSVNIKAVGDRFSGTYFVTSTSHVYRSGQSYTTYFTVSGHYPSTLLNLFRREEGAVSVPAAIGMAGLVIGLVTDNQDPKGLGRVKVKYPWLSEDHTSDWARVVIPGGGNQRGIEFLPEVDDEVLVGFEMGDIHYPYVLGGLWNGRDAPAAPQGKVLSGNKVQQRIIRSRTGHIITLDDNDSGGGISIEDKNGNKVLLDSAANNLTITVKGDASIQAQGNLTLEAKGGQVQIKGMNVNMEAQTGQTQIKGIGVSVNGGPATVDIKGTLINLN